MSRIGKNPIALPQGVEVSVNDNVVTVKGKLGELTQEITSGITVKIDEVFDSTGSATIYKKDDPFQVLKEGDILIRK